MGKIRPHMTTLKVKDEEEEERIKRERKEEGFKYLKVVNDSKILWLLLIGLFLLYIVFKYVMLATAAAVVIAVIVLLEIWVGIKTGGLWNEVRETALAVMLALLLWYGGGFLLNTSSPLDAVVSCSMRPALERGDMLLLQGGDIKAPVVQLTREEWREIRAAGLLNRQCAICITPTYDGSCLIEPGGEVVEHDELFSYECKLCERENGAGEKEYIGCTTGVFVKDTKYLLGNSRDVVVYTPQPDDLFARSGDIVHRAQLVIDVEGDKYVLAKGDNNNWFDVQIGNAPVHTNRVVGKVLFNAPYIGYFKLFISGLFEVPLGCDESFTGTEAIKIDR